MSDLVAYCCSTAAFLKGLNLRELSKFFLKVSEQILEAQKNGETGLTVPVDDPDLAVAAIHLLNQTEVTAEICLVLRWKPRVH